MFPRCVPHPPPGPHPSPLFGSQQLCGAPPLPSVRPSHPLAVMGRGTKKGVSGKHKKGSRTRAKGYQGQSGWETFKANDSLLQQRKVARLHTVRPDRPSHHQHRPPNKNRKNYDLALCVRVGFYFVGLRCHRRSPCRHTLTEGPYPSPNVFSMLRVSIIERIRIACLSACCECVCLFVCLFA
jgi:hypothetical protein